MIMWCTGRTGQREDFTLWIQVLGRHHDCCLAIALVLLKLDREKRFPRVLQNVVFIFCCSQSKHLLLFLFFVYPIHPKVSFITRWKMRVKAYRFFFLYGLENSRMLFFFLSSLHLQFLFMACHYLLQSFIPSPSLPFSLSIDLIL